MLPALALGWPFLLLRSLLALAIGIVAVVSPVWSTFGMRMVIGAYALCDGALALILAVMAHDQRGFGVLLCEAVVRAAVGVVALALPAMSALALMRIFAVWALS